MNLDSPSGSGYPLYFRVLLSEVWKFIDGRLDGVPLALAVAFMDVGAGVADDVHADFLGDL